MTRKCVLCRETNYKNNCSFFSAPKDPEVRKKWQNAIDIENYVVTDDTYVCSKHFHKNDIITHWVSGVPPHVITIKYKKCRLRPGAVPDINLYTGDPLSSCEKEFVDKYLKKYEVNVDGFASNQRDIETIEHLDDDEDATNIANFIHSKNSDSSNVQISKDFLQPEFISLDSHDSQENGIFVKNNRTITYANAETTHSNRARKKLKHDAKKCVYFERVDDNTSIFSDCKNSNIAIKTVGDLFKEEDSFETSKQNSLDLESDFTEVTHIKHDMILFEDLLEMCTEMMLPKDWTCTVRSKGHATTVIYMYINVTQNGIPFVEKQISLQNDMLFHCVILNREIDPIIHNLFRGEKPLKMRTLADLEELIDEFDQRCICQGTSISENCQDMNILKMMYRDAFGWRHISCPLIVNNDSSRCSRCMALSQITKSGFEYPFSNHDVSVAKNGKKKRTGGPKITNMRECDSRYEIIRPIRT